MRLKASCPEPPSSSHARSQLSLALLLTRCHCLRTLDRQTSESQEQADRPLSDLHTHTHTHTHARARPTPHTTNKEGDRPVGRKPIARDQICLLVCLDSSLPRPGPRSSSSPVLCVPVRLLLPHHSPESLRTVSSVVTLPLPRRVRDYLPLLLLRTPVPAPGHPAAYHILPWPEYPSTAVTALSRMLPLLLLLLETRPSPAPSFTRPRRDSSIAINLRAPAQSTGHEHLAVFLSSRAAHPAPIPIPFCTVWPRIVPAASRLPSLAALCGS